MFTIYGRVRTKKRSSKEGSSLVLVKVSGRYQVGTSSHPMMRNVVVTLSLTPFKRYTFLPSIYLDVPLVTNTILCAERFLSATLVL